METDVVPTVDTLLGEARRILAATSPTPGLDARLLVTHALGLAARDLIAHGGQPVAAGPAEECRRAVRRRAAGEPVHRIMGWREFYGLRLVLSPQTLEPRPDTETLVEAALPHLREFCERKGRCAILDVGTGTGAIALALLSHEPRATALGTDISAQAVATARRNAAAHALDDRFEARVEDGVEGLRERFCLLVSNPPYIASREIDSLAAEVRGFDPRLALDGGADGLQFYRRLAVSAAARLEDDGVVALEIGAGQEEAVANLFAGQGFAALEARSDLSGTVRALVFRRPARAAGLKNTGLSPL